MINSVSQVLIMFILRAESSYIWGKHKKHKIAFFFEVIKQLVAIIWEYIFSISLKSDPIN